MKMSENISMRSILITVAVIIAALAYYFFDPADSIYAPKCMFHLVTGWDCPGCGSQRMLHALLNGDFRGAWESNAFLLCALPLLVIMAFAAIFRLRFPKLYAIVNSLPSIIIIALSILLWTLLRNIIN